MRDAKLRGMFSSVHALPAVVGACVAPGHGPALLLALSILTAGTPGMAASQVEIRLRGVVPAVCTVSVSNASSNLNIVQGESGTQIATVTELCNAVSGYKVSVESANGGRMMPDLGGVGIAYSLSYDTAAVGSGGGLVAERAPTGAARQSVLSATLPASPQANAGNYSDTVTVSISAK
ncbi:Csu type fimbrial protein [Indioceanicola profundi]|uniref:hypothetical protein n=1 Tax=Indioceanicola profundi TaxID=2220096 RepID=UPI000E6A9B5D|nr:hypothetical protein [Indioceanicola profundi]